MSDKLNAGYLEVKEIALKAKFMGSTINMMSALPMDMSFSYNTALSASGRNSFPH